MEDRYMADILDLCRLNQMEELDSDEINPKALAFAKKQACRRIKHNLPPVADEVVARYNKSMAETKALIMMDGYQSVITWDEELDIIQGIEWLQGEVKSIPNPDRLGTKDQYIAWI